MATVSNKIVLGIKNTVQIGTVPDKQHAEVIITINGKEVFNKTFSAGIESFEWDLGFDTKDFESIFNSYFNSDLSSVSAKMTVTVFYSGVKNLLRGGKHDISFQLIDNTETKPKIDSVTLLPVSDKEFAKYIQGKTKAKCSVTSQGKYGATIKSVAVSIDGKSYRDEGKGFISDWLCYSGYRNVVVTVTDSRGFRSTKTEKIYVEPYSPPIIVPAVSSTSIECRRWNPDISKFDDANGTQCRMLFGVYASYIEDINSSFLCSYRYKKIAADSDFVDGKSKKQIPFTSSSSQEDVDLLIEDGTTTDEKGKKTGCFGIENEYLVELTVTDSLGEKATKTFRLDVFECIYHILGKRFSVGKYATKEEVKEEVFDSAWTIHTDKNLSVDGKVEKLGEPLPVNFGGTGAETSADARENLGINLKNLGVSSTAADLNLMEGVQTSGVTTDNIKYLNGLKSNVQDQLDGKASSLHTHSNYALSSHTHSDYAPSDHEHDMEDIITTPSVVKEHSSSILPKNIIDASSNVSVVADETWATVWGKVCVLYVSFTYGSDLKAGNFDNISIGTLKDAYKPKTSESSYVGCHSGGAGPVASGEITNEGELRLSALSSGISGGKKISLTATYLLR